MKNNHLSCKAVLKIKYLLLRGKSLSLIAVFYSRMLSFFNDWTKIREIYIQFFTVDKFLVVMVIIFFYVCDISPQPVNNLPWVFNLGFRRKTTICDRKGWYFIFCLLSEKKDLGLIRCSCSLFNDIPLWNILSTSRKLIRILSKVAVCFVSLQIMLSQNSSFTCIYTKPFFGE